MTQEELLEKTRTLMGQVGLVEGFGLGREWAIVASCADWMAPYPRQRYEALRDRLLARWPGDAHEIHEAKAAPRFTSHLCLRAGSEAMRAFLSRDEEG